MPRQKLVTVICSRSASLTRIATSYRGIATRSSDSRTSSGITAYAAERLFDHRLRILSRHHGSHLCQTISNSPVIQSEGDGWA